MSAAILRLCGDRLLEWTDTAESGTQMEDVAFNFEANPPYKGAHRYATWISFISATSDLALDGLKIVLVDPRNGNEIVLFDDEDAGTTKYVTAQNDGDGYILPTHKGGARDWKVRFTVSKTSETTLDMTILYGYIRMGDDLPFWEQAVGHFKKLFAKLLGGG